MIFAALRSGEHGVVVRHSNAACVDIREQRSIDAPDAHDQSIGRRARDEVVERAPCALCRDGECTILVEAAGVAQIGDVLACGA